MPRTRVWNEGLPGGTQQIRDLDDEQRNTKRDIREVFNQLIGNSESDALTDPVVATDHTLSNIRTTLDGYITADTNVVRRAVISSYDLQGIGSYSSKGTQNNLYTTAGTVDGSQIFAAAKVVLPVGVTVTSIDYYLKQDDPQLTGSLQFIGAILTTTATGFNNNKGIVPTAGTPSKVTSTFSHVTVSTNYYYILVSMVNGTGTTTDCRFYHAVINYTSPSSATRY